jgi:hypothetical protein
MQAVLSYWLLGFSPAEMVGVPDLSSQTVWHQVTTGGYDTGMELLIEAADALDMTAKASEASEDRERFSSLANRVRSYLAVSRPTTMLGMPRILSSDHRLTEESVIHRSGPHQPSHIRVLPE